jgi:hypothetical protein
VTFVAAHDLRRTGSPARRGSDDLAKGHARRARDLPRSRPATASLSMHAGSPSGFKISYRKPRLSAWRCKPATIARRPSVP